MIVRPLPKADGSVSKRGFLGLVPALLCPFVITVFLFPADAAGLEKKKPNRSRKAGSAVEPPSDQAKAHEHYAAGKRLYDEGKFDEALKEFKAAFEIKAHPTVLKSIAECQFQAGDLSAALDTFQQYVDNPESSDKDAIRARIQELKNMPLKVFITSHPAGAKISVDGKGFDAVTPADIELVPGEYVITLFVDGSPPVSRDMTVRLSGHNELSVDFLAEAGIAQPENALADPFNDEGKATTNGFSNESDKKRLPPAFWISITAAGVGLVSGTVFGALALGDEKDYKSAPTRAKLNSGERKAIIADVSLGFAGAAAVMSTVIWLTNRNKEKKEKAASGISVLPTTGRHGAGVSATFPF